MTRDQALKFHGQIYEHYKGGIYRVIGEAKHTETGEIVVMYEHLWPHKHSYFVRPRENFYGTVEVDGKLTRRFKSVK